MKQGSGHSSSGDRKREPISHAVSPAAAGQIGVAQAYPRATAQLYEGRGIEAPKATSTTHHCGSQGRHK